jgi:geranylgeranyl diphosphate synthase type I
MDIYDQITSYFSTLPAARSWSEAQRIFRQAASGKPDHWLLSLKACEAVGGTPEQAVPAILAIACAQIGILLVDDMLDDDPRGEYRRIGAAQAANLASVFLSAGSQAILYSQAAPATKLAALQAYHQMIVTTAFGQSLDVENPEDEEAYWRVVVTKSAPFFGAALYLGALLGGASEQVADPLEQVGGLYGEMIQIYDDIQDTLEIPANPDWRQGRSPLPILFARVVDHPDRAHFMELYQNISEEGALPEAQEILLRCGAMSYCVDQLVRRYARVQGILKGISLVKREAITALLEAVIAPVQNLLQACKV